MEIILSYWERGIAGFRNFWDSRSHRRNVLILSLLYGARFLLTLSPVSPSGDAVWKWRLLRMWTENGFYPAVAPEHHQGRWALNLPVKLLMEIFGTSWPVYYIFPLAMGLVCALAIYAVTAELRGKSAGAFAFLLFLLFPFTADECVQFLPMVPAAAWTLLALLAMFRFTDTGKTRWTLLAGLLLGLGYGCKVTTAYWFAPFGLYLLFVDRERSVMRGRPHFSQALFWFVLGGLTVLAGEWLFLNAFFHVENGRLSMLLAGHISHRVRPQYLTFGQYCLSFLRLIKTNGKFFDLAAWNLLLLCVAASALLLLLGKRKRDLRMTLTLGSFAMVGLLHCYVVYKVFPFLHPEKPHVRYLLTWISVGMILTAASLRDWKKILDARDRRIAPVLFVLIFGSMLTLDLIAVFNLISRDESPVRLIKYRQCFRTAELPVLQQVDFTPEGDIRKKDMKCARMFLAVYGPPASLSPDDPDRLYTDEHGRTYLFLWGPEIADGAPVRTVVCREEEVARDQLTLKRAKKR